MLRAIASHANRIVARLAVRIGEHLHRIRRDDTGAMTVEQIGWALFWVLTIATIVGMLTPWLLAKVNTIMGSF